MSSVSSARPGARSLVTRHLRTLAACMPVVLLPALVSCSPAAPASTPQPAGSAPDSGTTTSAGAPSTSRTAITATVSAAPAKFAMDGEVSEWEVLEPGSDVAKAMDSESRIAVAFRPTNVVIAARLEGAAKDGAIVTIGDVAPELPPIGIVARGGGTVAMDCEYEQEGGPEGAIEKGPRKPPEVEAACKAAKARYAEMAAKHSLRFVRRYKLDREGARFVGVDGQLEAIPGVQSAFKPTAAGLTVEVTFPIAALPRVSAAPIQAMGLAAQVASPMPALPKADELPRQDLPEPVEFEPYSALRTFAFTRAGGAPFSTSAHSYQPGEGLSVESFEYSEHDHMAVKLLTESLFEKKGRLGNIDVGVAMPTSMPCFVTMKDGQAIDYIPILDADRPPTNYGPPLELKGIVERNGQLHAFFLVGRVITMSAGWLDASWTVLTANAEGQIAPADIDWSKGDVGMWRDQWGFSSTDLTSFGYRGMTDMPSPGESLSKPVGLEVLFSWDAKAKKYTAKKKQIPTPKPPKGYQVVF